MVLALSVELVVDAAIGGDEAGEAEADGDESDGDKVGRSEADAEVSCNGSSGSDEAKLDSACLCTGVDDSEFADECRDAALVPERVWD